MKSKYFYNGEPLVEYCKKHPEYKYDRLTKYISIKKKEDPSRDANDIIEEFLNKQHRSNTRYIINGMNLSKYCKAMGISYTAVSKDISRSKKNSKYSDMDEDELISMIIDKHLVGNTEELVFNSSEKKVLELTNK